MLPNQAVNSHQILRAKFVGKYEKHYGYEEDRLYTLLVSITTPVLNPHEYLQIPPRLPIPHVGIIARENPDFPIKYSNIETFFENWQPV